MQLRQLKKLHLGKGRLQLREVDLSHLLLLHPNLSNIIDIFECNSILDGLVVFMDEHMDGSSIFLF